MHWGEGRERGYQTCVCVKNWLTECCDNINYPQNRFLHTKMEYMYFQESNIKFLSLNMVEEYSTRILLTFKFEMKFSLEQIASSNSTVLSDCHF